MASKFFKLPSGKVVRSGKSGKATRQNVVMSAIVEFGVMLLKHKGVTAVARFLAVAGVPMRVVTRVLLRPDLRRNLKRRRYA
jgi:hypothetical protein